MGLGRGEEVAPVLLVVAGGALLEAAPRSTDASPNGVSGSLGGRSGPPAQMPPRPTLLPTPAAGEKELSPPATCGGSAGRTENPTLPAPSPPLLKDPPPSPPTDPQLARGEDAGTEEEEDEEEQLRRGRPGPPALSNVDNTSPMRISDVMPMRADTASCRLSASA